MGVEGRAYADGCDQRGTVSRGRVLLRARPVLRAKTFIVPPMALQQVQRLFESKEALEVAKSGNHLGFRADGTEVYTRLLEGTYPNYEQVIPKDNDKVRDR